MSRKDLEELKQRSKLITKEEIERRKRDAYLSQKALHDKADMRKTKMRELEEEAKKHVPTISAELEAIEAANPMLKKVYDKMDSEADDVKTLRARLNRMKNETILGKQIKEKKELEEYQHQIDQAWDDEMEERRIDEIQKYRQGLEERKQKNAIFKVKIEDQLAERELERILEKERIEMEGEMMLEKIRQDQIEAERRQIEKAKEQKRRAKELEDFNKLQESHKYDRLMQELEEDKKITLYNKRKDKEAMDENRRKQREAKQKALECERIRAKQERFQDQQAQADERRAAEYQREVEKKERLDEQKKKEAYDKLMNQVMLERKMQIEYKAKKANLEKENDERERIKLIREQNIQIEREKKESQKRRELNEWYGSELKKQYEAVEDNKREAELQRLRDAEQEERQRQIQYLRERRLIEKQLRDHINAGYKPPPIRTGVVADVLNEIMGETPEEQKC